ncbi:CEBPA: CCAAT/enhancer-binding protein alpha-like protein [Dinothrombium tinctorium]|uniref:CEBPA: CCAAT/enhancer-binding protein alpha-like protein n=1 Tax=Dinothrombium tinctorium TaxID=1965070 RepID=A0A3S3P759_9ACAR|nr:CEBPA: CCAAT/enhancer-binding protein alpha-like protein [Dinothrombium tinctorium]RWS06655.1 CEBPA: CCAAT/enhancer-binding protein alpha-like protein [Dinothrombium tinctorium]
MDSPNLYENGSRFVANPHVNAVNAIANKCKNVDLSAQLNRTKISSSRPVGAQQQVETSNLNSPEISLNLQQLIQSENDPHATTLALDDAVFTDLLTEARNNRNLAAGQSQGARHPTQNNTDSISNKHINSHHQHYNPYSLPDSQSRGGQPFAPELSIKREPLEDPADYSSSCSRSSVCSPGPVTNGIYRGPPSPSLLNEKSVHGMGKKMGKKNLDKSSEEYKKRRERNNIAVRKSREKAKQRSRDTEKKVSELQKANDALHKEIEMLQKELDVVKSMLNSAGIHPNTIENEVQKCLGEYRHRYGVLNTNA